VATSLVGFAMIVALLGALVAILAGADRLFSGGRICSPSPREARRTRRAQRAAARRERRECRELERLLARHVLPYPLVVVAAPARAVAASVQRIGRGVASLPARRATARAGRRCAPRPAARREFAPPLVAARRPLQVVAADLRRLDRELALVPAGTPLVRWRALWTAYDGVLMEAAELLEVAHELRELPLLIGLERDFERLRVLAALEAAGLVVR
jgi:hypothetical protein